MSFARRIATVGSATLVSRITGFLRDLGIAAVLGAGAWSDALFAALLLPNLFRRLLAEGALNASFVPMWLRSDAEAGAPAARRFGEQVLGTLALGLAALAGFCAVFAPTVIQLLAPGFAADDERFAHAVALLRLAIGYIVIAGVVAVAAARLNAEGRIRSVSVAVVIFNGIMLAAVAIVWGAGLAAPPAASLVSISVVLAGVGQLMVVGAALLRLRDPPLLPRVAWNPNLARFYRRALPGVVAVGLPQLTLIAGAIVASASPNAVSWLYYAYRLYELPLGFVAMAVSAVMLPSMAAAVRAREPQAIAAAQSRSLEISVGLAVPAAIGLALLALPIATALFERGAFGPHDSAAVAAAVAVIAFGLPGHVLEKVFGALCFAHEDTGTPMRAGLFGLAAAAIGAVLLFPRYGHVGVAAAVAVSGWVGTIILAVALARRGWLVLDGLARRRLPRLLAAACIMGGVVATVQSIAAWLGAPASATTGTAAMIVLVLLGVGVYAGLVRALGIVGAGEVLAALRVRS